MSAQPTMPLTFVATPATLLTYRASRHRQISARRPATPLRFRPTCTVTPPPSAEDDSSSLPDDGVDEDEAMIVQGPAQAPTKAGVSTAGLQGADAKLLEASYEAEVSGIEAALKDGADVNAIDVNGRTSLHFCAGNGLQTLVKDLVDRGAQLNRQDILGLTPLHMAAGYKMNTTVKVLVELGADANVTSLDGKLPVEIAEGLLEATPKKKFFMENKSHTRLKEIVDILDEATEVEEGEDEDEDEDSMNNVDIDQLQPGDEREEEIDGNKFVVRVKPTDTQTEPTPSPTIKPDDVKVTVRVKEPQSKSTTVVNVDDAKPSADDVKVIVREASAVTDDSSTTKDDVQVTVRIKEPEKKD